MKVVDAMWKDVFSVDEGVSVVATSRSMSEKGEGYVIILRQGMPVGVVTERYVTWKVAGEELDPKNVNIGSFMSTPLITVDQVQTL